MCFILPIGLFNNFISGKYVVGFQDWLLFFGLIFVGMGLFALAFIPKGNKQNVTAIYDTSTRNSNLSNDDTFKVQYKDLPRKPFTKWIKESTLKNQEGKCNMCSIPLNNYIAEYDHKDGDKTNNQLSNCQALCANCHSEKTKMTG